MNTTTNSIRSYLSTQAFVKRWLCRLWFSSGLMAFALRGRGRTSRILAYHSVSNHETDDTCGLGTTIPTGLFNRHIKYLSRHYAIVPLDRFVRETSTNTLGQGKLAITFDDGYRDNALTAWPILRCYGATATVFICPSAIESGRLLWPNRLALLRSRLGPSGFAEAIQSRWPKLHVQKLKAPLHCWVDALGTQATHAEIDSGLDAWESEIAPTEDTPHRSLYMDWKQVRSLHTEGMSFGNHTWSHPNLARQDATTQWREIIKGSDAIRSELGDGVALPFAFPFGRIHHFTPASTELVRKSRHTCALAGEPLNNVKEPFTIGRNPIPAESVPELVCRLEFGTFRNLISDTIRRGSS